MAIDKRRANVTYQNWKRAVGPTGHVRELR